MRKLFVPTYGHIEIQAPARPGRGTLAALWPIGSKDLSDRLGEITVMEDFDLCPRDAGVEVSRGIKGIDAPNLNDEVVFAAKSIRI